MYKLFSQRKKEEAGEISDVYSYDEFPNAFRNQFFHIIKDVFSLKEAKYYNGYVNSQEYWEISCSGFAREKGLKNLPAQYGCRTNNEEAFEYYVDSSNNEDFLDFMDYVLTEVVDGQVSSLLRDQFYKNIIKELNDRFRQHSLGYEFINGALIIKSNEQIHKEIIVPAIHLLNNEKFSGAEEEYFKAFNFYKEKNYKEAITNATKAFESVMKIICKEMNYSFDPDKDTVKKLVSHLKNNNFFPAYLENHIHGVITTLESGVGVLRNREAGHGQGQDVVDISNEYVEYALNLVATNSLLLVKIFNNIR